MPAWDLNLSMLAIAYLTFFLGLAGWAVYARGRIRAISTGLDRRAREGSDRPGERE